MKSFYRRLIPTTILFFSISVFSAYSAERVDLRIDPVALPALQQNASTQTFGSAPAVKKALINAIGLSANGDLKLLNSSKDERTGWTHKRFRQTYNGIPVWGEEILVTEKTPGIVSMLHGNAILGIDQEISSVRSALDAKSVLNDIKEMHIAQEAGLRTNDWFFEREESERVIFIDDKGQSHLAFAVTFFADVKGGGHPTRPTYIVDAITGETLFHFEGLAHAQLGTGPGGNQKIGRYYYGNQYGKLDVTVSGGTYTMNNSRVKTVDLNGGKSGSTAYSYWGPENKKKYINGAYSPLNDAHYFGGVIYDMYKNWYNTAPLTFQLTMRVHYGTNYENAFWNGSSMTFGDGGSYFYPLVCLDVSAHEVSHGFTEQNSNLIYSGMSGGINESFSDMAGEAAEFFSRGSNDWLIGYDIKKGAGALRYMDDPTKDGRSIGSANAYYAGMDVHLSSGVFNKAFYTLAKRPGWGTRKAFDVFVKANQRFWTAGATFKQAAQGAKDAAAALGYNTNDIVAAFAAVDIPLSGTIPPVPNTTLKNGQPITINGTRGEWKHFTIDVPSGVSMLKVTTSGGTGDADLYVRYGAKADSYAYDCRPYLSGNNETCTTSYPSAGLHYVSIYGYASYSNMSVKASY